MIDRFINGISNIKWNIQWLAKMNMHFKEKIIIGLFGSKSTLNIRYETNETKISMIKHSQSIPITRKSKHNNNNNTKTEKQLSYVWSKMVSSSVFSSLGLWIIENGYETTTATKKFNTKKNNVQCILFCISIYYQWYYWICIPFFSIFPINSIRNILNECEKLSEMRCFFR